jgi:hypothetical protein
MTPFRFWLGSFGDDSAFQALGLVAPELHC